jgi:hypothetical protein
MTKRIPWWAVRIFWSSAWVGVSLILLARDIRVGADNMTIAVQAIIFLLWGWFAFCDIHRWNRPGKQRYFPSVNRRNKDE